MLEAASCRHHPCKRQQRAGQDDQTQSQTDQPQRQQPEATRVGCVVFGKSGHSRSALSPLSVSAESIGEKAGGVPSGGRTLADGSDQRDTNEVALRLLLSSLHCGADVWRLSDLFTT